jgi:hypothetical protein
MLVHQYCEQFALFHRSVGVQPNRYIEVSSDPFQEELCSIDRATNNQDFANIKRDVLSAKSSSFMVDNVPDVPHENITPECGITTSSLQNSKQLTPSLENNNLIVGHILIEPLISNILSINHVETITISEELFSMQSSADTRVLDEHISLENIDINAIEVEFNPSKSDEMILNISDDDTNLTTAPTTITTAATNNANKNTKTNKKLKSQNTSTFTKPVSYYVCEERKKAIANAQAILNSVNPMEFDNELDAIEAAIKANEVKYFDTLKFNIEI